MARVETIDKMIFLLSLTPRFSGVTVDDEKGKTVLTVMKRKETFVPHDC
jgi:hypothetical protein